MLIFETFFVQYTIKNAILIPMKNIINVQIEKTIVDSVESHAIESFIPGMPKQTIDNEVKTKDGIEINKFKVKW